MKLPIRRIAAFLLAALLLLQMGGAVASVILHAAPDWFSDEQQVVALDMSAHLQGHGPATTTGSHGSAPTDCVSHCTLGAVAEMAEAPVLPPCFESAVIPPVRLELLDPDRIERPPKLASC